MQTLQRTAVVLIWSAIACLGAACDGKNAPTEVPAEAASPAPELPSMGSGLQAVPFAFVGKADDCGTGYPAGSRIVTAAWLGGMGLPDNGGANVGLDPTDNPNKTDPHLGLLLSKNGTTPDCSASGAEIKGVRGTVVTALSELGFDYRNGGHCGAGAPRFNVVVKDNANVQTFHFVGGCSNGTPTPASQDPLQWTQVRFGLANPAQSFPVIPPGSKIVSIDLIYDEGTDTPTPASGNAGGIGLAVVDNIFIDGKVIRKGSGIADRPEPEDDDDDDDGKKDDDDDDDDNDGSPDTVDTDDDGDGVEDALQLQLKLPRIL